MKTLFFIFSITILSQYAYCCGPSFSPAYLNNDEWTYSPRMQIIYELEMLSRKFCKKQIIPYKKTKKISTLAAALSDLKDACHKMAIPEDEIQKILVNFKTARVLANEGKKPKDFSKKQQLKEFNLYIEGISQMHQDAEVLPQAWLKLLALSKEKRHYRTTWVLYMLGNINLRKNAALAHEYYEKLRIARNKNYTDTANLAYASYHNEYHYADSIRNKYKYILACYAVAAQAKDVNLINAIIEDLIYLNRKYYSVMSDSEKKQILKDPIAREMILLAESIHRSIFPAKTLELIGDVKIACAERLAWLAYYRGNFKECKRFLDLTNDNSIVKLWLLARFARRERKYDKAAGYLRKWLVLYKNSKFNPVCLSREGEKACMDKDIYGLYGTILVHQQNIAEALYSFLKISFGEDAAFLAERMVKTDELINFCKNHKSSFDKNTRKNLEHLLARRLMREKSYNEALKWMPSSLQEDVKNYIKLSRIGNDVKYSKNERALAFYNLAKLARWKGVSLFATELAPDYNFLGCAYNGGVLFTEWYHNKFDYSISYLVNRVPKSRYHYRYKASQLMMRAAMLATNVKLKATALYIGGSYIKYLDSQRADYYYKMLCDLRPFPLGIKAYKRRWFPEKISKALENEKTSAKPVNLNFINSVFEVTGLKKYKYRKSTIKIE